jgi:hypothetical protein
LVDLRRLFDLLRRGRSEREPHPGPQGEEHEIIVAEREAQQRRDRFAARLQRHSGNLDSPFLQDPFDDEKQAR